MSYKTKCAICGRIYYQESSTLAKLSGAANFAKDCKGTIFGGGTTLIRKGLQLASGKKDICPDCRRAGYTDDYGVETKAAAKAEESAQEAARREEARRQKEAHKSALRNIKNFEFPEDDSEFNRAINDFCDDYLECNAGLLADGDYKKTYKITAEKELKLLKDSNPAHYEKFKEAWSETQAAMKKALKKKLIISGIIAGSVSIIFGIIFGVGYDLNAFGGAACGLFFGCIIGLIPHRTKSKTDNE